MAPRAGVGRACAAPLRPPELLLALGLFILAVAVRALPSYRVFSRDGIQLFGNDSYFHMRGIAWSVEHFPASLTFDPYIQFPDGARPIVGPLFDWLVALAALPFVGALDVEGLARLETIAVWVPPILGGAAVIATWALARRHFGSRVAWVSGLLLTFLTAHVWYSQLGFVDHHVGVALLAVLQLTCALGLMTSHGEEPSPASGGWAIGFGCVTGLSFLMWPGSLLHLALVDTALTIAVASTADRSSAIAFARRVAIAHAISTAVVFPFSFFNEWSHLGAFAPVVLSEFQPWALAIATVSFALASLAWGHPGAGSTPIRRGAVLATLGALLLVASLFTVPGLREAADQVGSWLSRSDEFAVYQTIGEAQPLLGNAGRLDWTMATGRLSYFIFAFPVFVVWLGIAALREGDRRIALSLLFWATGLLIATLLQRRFFNSFSIGLALVVGIALVRLWDDLSGRLRGAGARPLVGASLVLLIVVAMWPAADFYRHHIDNHLAIAADRPVRLTRSEVRDRRKRQIAEWFRAHTPSPGGWLTPDVRPGYGVLAPSNMGHVLKYVGRRPVVVDNFINDVGGDGRRFLIETLRSSEDVAAPALAERGVRYVVASASSTWLGDDLPHDSLSEAMMGMGFGATQGAAPPPPALTRLRLVMELITGSEGEGAQPRYRVFEFVPGARLSGRASPMAVVRARLDLVLPDRSLPYVTTTRADATGAWVLRVPYSTAGLPLSVVSDLGYRISCGMGEVEVGVPEEAVRQGLTIPVTCRPAAADGEGDL